MLLNVKGSTDRRQEGEIRAAVGVVCRGEYDRGWGEDVGRVDEARFVMLPSVELCQAVVSGV